MWGGGVIVHWFIVSLLPNRETHTWVVSMYGENVAHSDPVAAKRVEKG